MTCHNIKFKCYPVLNNSDYNYSHLKNKSFNFKILTIFKNSNPKDKKHNFNLNYTSIKAISNITISKLKINNKKLLNSVKSLKNKLIINSLSKNYNKRIEF